jgi:hypothetical protein
MLMALDYIHNDVGVIHSGNQPYIHPSIMHSQYLQLSDFRLPNILLNAYQPGALSSILAENPVMFHPKKNDAHGSVPTFVSQPLPVPQGLLNGDTPAPSIVLIDFSGGAGCYLL